MPKGNQTTLTSAAPVILVGDSQTGKSCLAERMIQQTFSDNYKPTVGLDFSIKQVVLENSTVGKLLIFDISGEERYKLLVKNYYKKGRIACIFFDPTQRDTFNHVNEYLKDVQEKCFSNVKCFLVATKTDLITEYNREVTQEEAQRFADENGLTYFETSAKDNINIDVLAQEMARFIVLQASEVRHEQANIPLAQARSALATLETLRQDAEMKNSNAARCRALNTIIQYLEENHNADEIIKWKKEGAGKEALDTLQGTSYWNTVLNVITCFIAGVFFPIGIPLFYSNHQRYGNYGLFFAYDDKQLAERAIDLAAKPAETLIHN